MATIPVFACRKCGKPVYAVHLSARNDPNNSKLKSLMQNLPKIALCGLCLKAYNYYAAEGRSDEFLLNPHVVIYNIIDNSGLDYYGKNDK